ncbi:MAG TPA: tetratricopeptide repeat protein, partial [Candidatus Aminicenantes bacterium]|nr:tetratricopeptide repeat protein [Candidatus Aminicenantes bacterium]
VFHELEPRLIEARGTDHPDVLTLLRNEGIALLGLEREEEALALFDRTLEISSRMYDEDHPRVALALMDAGVALSRLQRYDVARPRLVRAFEIFLEKSGAEHPRTIKTAEELVDIAEKTGDEALAARYGDYAGE